MAVKAKKHLGQHFLTDKNICQKIAAQYRNHNGCSKVLEIGPGMGALTDFLLQREELDLYVMDIDRDSIAYLNNHYPKLKDKIIEADFLKMDLKKIMGDEPFGVVGNLPYNI